MPNENEMIYDLKELLQETGDSMMDVFEQMLIGGWVDDNDHPVFSNTAMINLNLVLWDIMQFRHKYLGYSNPDPMEKDEDYDSPLILSFI